MSALVLAIGTAAGVVAALLLVGGVAWGVRRLERLPHQEPLVDAEAPAWRCTRCGLGYRTGDPPPYCERGPCPMEPVEDLGDAR